MSQVNQQYKIQKLLQNEYDFKFFCEQLTEEIGAIGDSQFLEAYEFTRNMHQHEECQNFKAKPGYLEEKAGQLTENAPQELLEKFYELTGNENEHVTDLIKKRFNGVDHETLLKRGDESAKITRGSMQLVYLLSHFAKETQDLEIGVSSLLKDGGIELDETWQLYISAQEEKNTVDINSYFVRAALNLGVQIKAEKALSIVRYFDFHLKLGGSSETAIACLEALKALSNVPLIETQNVLIDAFKDMQAKVKLTDFLGKAFIAKKVEYNGKKLVQDKFGFITLETDKFEFGVNQIQLAVYSEQKLPFLFNLVVKKQDQIIVHALEYSVSVSPKVPKSTLKNKLSFPGKFEEKLLFEDTTNLLVRVSPVFMENKFRTPR